MRCTCGLTFRWTAPESMITATVLAELRSEARRQQRTQAASESAVSTGALIDPEAARREREAALQRAALQRAREEMLAAIAPHNTQPTTSAATSTERTHIHPPSRAALRHERRGNRTATAATGPRS
jgi:hypothetical protein